MLWAFLSQLVIYVFYIVCMIEVGAQGLLQRSVIALYGSVGAFIVNPFLGHNDFDAGAWIALAPLAGIIVFSLLIAIATTLCRKKNDAS
jgi:hypothetical protein